MTATVGRVLQGELTPKDINEMGQAAYDAGELLAEILEASEVLENHVLFSGDNGLEDVEVSLQVFANLASRIRKDAASKRLIQPAVRGCHVMSGRLAIGEALMAANYALSPARDLLVLRGAPAPETEKRQ
jgi:hypothetical protein